MKKSGLVRITALFFALMFCFTILSRAAYQQGTAVVKMSRPENRMIAHQIRAVGKVVQNQELAVVTEPDQRVTAIYVQEGQRVARGELLFEIDEKLLEEKILNQQQEMEKQQLQIQDAKSQKDVSAQQKANEQAQAAENYSLSTGSAGARLSRARRDLNKAKKALEEFRKSGGTVFEDSGVEEALEQQYEEKQEAYLAAEQELSTLEWKIENVVEEARTNALTAGSIQDGTAASLSLGETAHTRSEMDLLPDEDLIEEEGVGYSVSPTAPAGALQSGDGGSVGVLQNVEDGNTASFQNPESGDAGAFQESGSDLLLQDPEPDSGQSSQKPAEINQGLAGGAAENSGEENWEDLILEEEPGPSEDTSFPEEPAVSSGDGEPQNLSGQPGGDSQMEPVTEEMLDRLEQSLRSSYQPQLDAARKKAETARTEKEAAAAALAQYQQERLAASQGKNAQTEQQLIDAVNAAGDTYEDAALAANEAAVTSGRAVAAAGIPNASNSSDRLNEITYEQMELTLEKLEALKRAGGKVKAPADGLITKINITTGEKTMDTTAIRMADISQGYSFTAEITKEQEKYIGVGDLVTLTDNNKNKLEEIAVASVAADEEKEGIYHVSVQLPRDSYEMGTAVTLDFTKKSQTYSVCVPLSALRLDEKNQPYVLVLDEQESIMGTEQKARKVSVTVLEQDESYAALAEGTLSSGQEVIVGSDKAVEDGSRVRVAE